MLVEDRRRNPSNYAIVVVSEGASMLGGQVVEYGQEDAYGHRKLGGIGSIAVAIDGQRLTINGVGFWPNRGRAPD